jgi:hypothetical protein
MRQEQWRFVLGIAGAVGYAVYLWAFGSPWYYWLVAGPFCLGHAFLAAYWMILPEPKGLTEDEAIEAARQWMRDNNLDRRW